MRKKERNEMCKTKPIVEFNDIGKFILSIQMN